MIKLLHYEQSRDEYNQDQVQKNEMIFCSFTTPKNVKGGI